MAGEALAATPAGWLLVLVVALPLAGAMLAVLLGARWAERLALLLAPAGLGLAALIAAAVLHEDAALLYHLGGVAPPLGMAFRADGFSAAMLLMAAVVILAIALYARGGVAAGAGEDRATLAFWSLLLALWAAVNGVLVGDDLFNLFVALEVLTFAAVPLVCLDGSAATLAAALRYLIFALLGSVLYLLGTALLYGATGTLDLLLLAQLVRAEPATIAAAALMTAGLLAKTALFPLHLWLPPAHAGAPAAASAVLSALVVKASYFILLRLWFGALGGITGPVAPQLLGGLGAAAILVGSVLALRQARLKLLVAYSTVAQIGYLFLMVPLLAVGPATEWAAGAWLGGAMQVASHAFAKAAMFLAAGALAQGFGHDRIAGLGGAARLLPMSVLAFALGGLSLMGIPPSGGFVAKWLLLTSAVSAGQWWWALVVLGGGLLSGGYLYHVLAGALAGGGAGLVAAVPRRKEAVALALGILSLLLGMLPLGAFGLVQVGRLDLVAAGLR